MEWLKEFIKGLPLDKISEVVGEVVAWWSEQVKDIPAEDLPFNVYVGGSLIVIALWYFVARMLPKPFGGMSWLIVIAVLLTPGVSLGETGDIAPACVAVVYSILMKDLPGAARNFLPILLVIVAGFFLGFVWQMMRDAITQEAEAKGEIPKKKKDWLVSKIENMEKNKSKKKDRDTESKSTKIKKVFASLKTSYENRKK